MVRIRPSSGLTAVEAGKEESGDVTAARGTDDEDAEDAELPSLADVLWPFILTMSLFGLFHYRGQPSSRPDDSCRTRCRRLKQTLTQLYSAFILVVHWLNEFRVLAMFLSASAHFVLVNNAELALWYALNIVQSTSVFVGCARSRGGFWHLCRQVDGIDRRERRGLLVGIRKKCQRGLLAAWIILLLNIFFSVYQIWYTTSADCEVAPLLAVHLDVVAAKFVIFVIRVYGSAAWTMPLVFRNNLCWIIYYRFERLNRSFVEESKSRPLSQNLIGRYRKRHQDVCGLLEMIDDNVNVMTGLDIVIIVALVCLMLYSLIWDPDIRTNHMLMAELAFWIASALFMLGFISVGGALVNQQAHRISDHLHDLDLGDASAEMLGQLTVFINRVSTGSIGVTASKLFVINKQSILTVMGMLITYFVLIVQFIPVPGSTPGVSTAYRDATESNLYVTQTIRQVTDVILG